MRDSYAFLVVLQEQMMFSIPWKHAARHGWEVDKDACLFKQWAIHTGEACKTFFTNDPAMTINCSLNC